MVRGGWNVAFVTLPWNSQSPLSLDLFPTKAHNSRIYVRVEAFKDDFTSTVTEHEKNKKKQKIHEAVKQAFIKLTLALESLLRSQKLVLSDSLDLAEMQTKSWPAEKEWKRRSNNMQFFLTLSLPRSYIFSLLSVTQLL